MKKITLNFILISVLISVISACSKDSDKFVKKWTLTKVVGFGPEKDVILGVNNIFFDLRSDETFDARWYDENSSTDFIELKGKWLTTEVGEKTGKYDLFLFYGPGQKKSKIFTVTKVTDGIMIMNLSNIDHIFESK